MSDTGDFVIDLDQVKAAKEHRQDQECTAMEYYSLFARVFDHKDPLTFDKLVPLRLCVDCMARLSRGMLLAMAEMNALNAPR